MIKLLYALGLLASMFALFHQFMVFVLIHGNRSSNDPKNYTGEDIAQILTIIIIMAFMGIAIRKLLSPPKANNEEEEQ